MTSILVRKDPEALVWTEWTGTATVQNIVSTYNANYADGRIVEMPCDPYPVATTLDGTQVRSLYDTGIWSLGEVTNAGGKIAVPFTVPEGKRTVGSPTYTEDEDGLVQQQYAVEDIPPPPPQPTAEEKAAAMLGAFGLTIGEFHDVLDIAGRAA